MGFDLQPQGILSACLANGGQLAELYMEHTTGLSVVMDDGKVGKGGGRVPIWGPGLRLIHQLKTAYAHTNQVSPEGLMPLAQNLAAMVQGKAVLPNDPAPLKPGLVSARWQSRPKAWIPG